MHRQPNFQRRRLLALMAASAAGFGFTVSASPSREPSLWTKPIPSSGERIPVIGLGSSRTFNVGDDIAARDNCTTVMEAFFNAGGKMIDSSPMYGSSQDVIGYGLRKLNAANKVFSAEKVWTPGWQDGPEQITASRQLWGLPEFRLLQVHNLVDWDDHLPTLQAMKAAGNLGYVGITTSHGRRHDDLAELMRTKPLDFVQLSYNILNREAEQQLLPIAQERGIAVIVNRPFQRGDLIDELKGKPLPAWATDFGITSWPQFLLKYIVSHPAVTCAIPATSQVEHVVENMAACRGAQPDTATRQRMADYVANI